MRKRTIIYIVLGLLLLGWRPFHVWAQMESPKIEMEVTYGFQNNIKDESCVPLTVELLCREANVSGTLQVEIPIQSVGNLNASIWMTENDGMSNKEQSYVWEREIHLEKGESTNETFYLELPSSEVYVKVSFETADELLAQKLVNCDYSEKNSLLVGVISDLGNEQVYLNGMQSELSLSYDRDVFVKSFYLYPEDICENSAALNQLDILIANPDTKFSKIQKSSIAIWEKNGGIFYILDEDEEVSDALRRMENDEYKVRLENLLSNAEDSSKKENDFESIPVRKKISTFRYVVIILLYLVAIGPGLYLFMRRKKEPCWLIGSVCALSVGFMLLIYGVGKSNSMDSPTICYEAIYEQQGEYLSKNIDFSLMVYKMQDFELKLDSDYYILPRNVGPKGRKTVDVSRAETVTFCETDESAAILLQNMSAYSQNTFSMNEYVTLNTEEQIQITASANAENMQIQWKNPTSNSIEQAILILKNRAVVLDKIAPFSEGTLEDAPIYAYGANAITQLLNDLMNFSTYDFPEYELENLAEKIEESTEAEDEAFVIGILNTEENVFAQNVGFDVYGRTLIKINVDIDWQEGELYWYPNLEAYGENYRDGYDVVTNSLNGREMIVNYQVDTDLQELTFFQADYYDLKRFIPFQGKIYLFNWREGNFFMLTDWQEPLTATFLEPFKSSRGVIRVYYVVDEWLMNSNRVCMLPYIKGAGKVE